MANPRHPTRAAIYARISDDRDDNERGLGVKRQVEDCVRLADELGWATAPEPYVDNDLSALKARRRPRWEDLLADIEAGRVDGIIAYDVDRMARRPMDLERVLNFADSGRIRDVALVDAKGGVDIAGSGLVFMRIKVALAAEESRKQSERLRRKHKELAERGKTTGGGRRPFGYQADRVTINEPEAMAIRHMAAMILDDDATVSDCIRWLEAEGIKTPPPKKENPNRPYTGKWHTSVVQRALLSPRTAGLREHRGSIVGDAQWEPILDRATWDALRRRLTDRAAARTQPRARPSIVAKLVWCPACERAMVPQGSQGKAYTPDTYQYTCPGTRGGCWRTIAWTTVEDVTEQWVMKHLADKRYAKRINAAFRGGDKTELVRALDDAETEHRAAVQRLVAAIDPDAKAIVRVEVDAYAERVADLRTQMRAVGSLRRATRQPTASTTELAGAWDAFTIAEKHAVVTSLVSRIEIAAGRRNAGPKPQPDRVNIVPVWDA